jgi:hypothetical protein
MRQGFKDTEEFNPLTISLLMLYIYGAPDKARKLTYIYMDEIFTGDFAF